jgi:very-short-patch-repair endonuclease
MKKLKEYNDKIEWLKTLKTYDSYFQNEKFLKNINIVREYVNTFEKFPNMAQKRYLELLCDICSLYEEGIQEKITQYKNETKTKIKVKIRYGDEGLQKFMTKLKNKPKGEPDSWTMISYWTKRGYSEEDAIIMRNNKRKIASKNGVKTRRQNNNYKGESRLSIEYWTIRGYSLEDAEKMRAPYLYKIKNTPSRYIETHGEELGMKIYNDAIQRRKNKIIAKYGSLVVTGYTSTESLKVLVKLYKSIRKRGISKNDIVWGISNNKEFILTDFEKNKSYFYDFVVKSKKIIIEYNNSFWHPRVGKEWKGILNYDELLKRDKDKEELAIIRGYRVHYIWDDDDIEAKINELTLEILND